LATNHPHYLHHPLSHCFIAERSEGISVKADKTRKQSRGRVWVQES